MSNIVERTVQVICGSRMVEADVELRYETDWHYGADADGNRGMPMDFLEESTVKEVRDLDGNVFYNNDKDVPEDLWDKIIGAAEGEGD